MNLTAHVPVTSNYKSDSVNKKNIHKRCQNSQTILVNTTDYTMQHPILRENMRTKQRLNQNNDQHMVKKCRICAWTICIQTFQLLF